MLSLAKPKTGDVLGTYGYSLTSQRPKYLVLPTSLPSRPRESESCQVKIVDFGEAFLHGHQRGIRCPLSFRSPEAVLTSKCDFRADIWSLGCIVYRLFYSIQVFLLMAAKDIRAYRRIPSFRHLYA
jgi:serine/threonine protein kinase